MPAEESERPISFKRLEIQTLVPDTHVAVVVHLNGITVEITESASQQTLPLAYGGASDRAKMGDFC